MRKLLITLLAAAVLLIVACTPDAPRSNPLDPYHQTAVESGEKLAGQVVRKTAPFPPLPGCNVFILPESKFTTTDDQGRFLFTGLQSVEHQLIAHKIGFDSIRVAIPADSVADAGFFLIMNARPRFDAVSIHSEYIDQWWPDPVLSIVLGVTLHDPDGPGDIQSLSLKIAGMDTSFVLSATARPDSFTLRLQQEGFPGRNLFDIVGAAMQVTALDKDSSRAVFTGAKLIRIISPTPVATSPTGLAVAEPAPLLQWQPFIASFRFSTVVSIYFIRAGVPTLMFNSTPLPAQQLGYQYPDSLASGTYFWTVSAVDEFGNIGRSKEASFTVP